jgi:hypothetical protein
MAPLGVGVYGDRLPPRMYAGNFRLTPINYVSIKQNLWYDRSHLPEKEMIPLRLARLPLARHSKSVNSLKKLKTTMGAYSK